MFKDPKLPDGNKVCNWLSQDGYAGLSGGGETEILEDDTFRHASSFVFTVCFYECRPAFITFIILTIF